jgi:hypothetical protein
MGIDFVRGRSWFSPEMVAVVTVVAVVIFAGINSSANSTRGYPPKKSIFDKGERVTVRVNNSTGIVKNIYYWPSKEKPEGWHYDVRTDTMEIVSFAEDELAKSETPDGH